MKAVVELRWLVEVDLPDYELGEVQQPDYEGDFEQAVVDEAITEAFGTDPDYYEVRDVSA